MFEDMTKSELYAIIAGEGLDALVYIMLAFFATMPTDALIVMVIVQAVVKTVYEIIVYPLTKHVISTVRALPDN